jgi:hypothetical protein
VTHTHFYAIQNLHPMLTLLSFERFNGILGKFNHSNRTIEVQIMRQFQQSQQLHMPWTCEYGAEFASILGRQMVGTLSCNDTADMLYVKHSVLVSAERKPIEVWGLQGTDTSYPA